jgi:hypothetical protein
VKLVMLSITATIALAAASTAFAGKGAGGVSDGPAFYVDGALYRTVGTPTDLSGTGAPARSFDTIYEFFGAQLNVATAAPGDPDYNGGRWRVLPVNITDYDAALAAGDANENGVLDSDAELAAAAGSGLTIGTTPIKSFVCPVIKLPSS